jgi:hypothetical protein
MLFPRSAIRPARLKKANKLEPLIQVLVAAIIAVLLAAGMAVLVYHVSRLFRGYIKL